MFCQMFLCFFVIPDGQNNVLKIYPMFVDFADDLINQNFRNFSWNRNLNNVTWFVYKPFNLFTQQTTASTKIWIVIIYIYIILLLYILYYFYENHIFMFHSMFFIFLSATEKNGTRKRKVLLLKRFNWNE